MSDAPRAEATPRHPQTQRAGPRILVIGGPTASGKTALALDLARALGGEVIGADSVQIYRGVDIGSAKPTAEELAGTPHRLMDVADPDEPFDAARYAQLADEAIATAHALGRPAIVAGGTGLYLRALVKGLAEGIASDPVVRVELRARAESSAEELARMHDELKSVDPVYAAKVHPTDPIRVVRALEVYRLTGEPLSSHHARHAMEPPRYEAMFLALDVDTSTLRERIAARTRAMMAQRWAEEVRTLTERYGREIKPLQSVGYAQMVAHVLDGVSASETEESIVRATALFAKRQRTWFRGEPGVQWVSASTVDKRALCEEAKRFLESA